MQRKVQTHLPLFVFLTRQSLQPLVEHEEGFSFTLISCQAVSGEAGSRPLDKPCRKWGRENGAEAKHETRKGMKKSLTEKNIVVAVFYAVVVSSLVSAYLSIGTPCAFGFEEYWHECMYCMSPEYFSSWSETTEIAFPGCNWMLPLAYFIFLTGYFYDEWALNYSGRDSCRADVVVWSLYLLQSAALKYVKVSALLGIVGTLIAGLVLFHGHSHSPVRKKLSVKRELHRCLYYIWEIENLIWVAALAGVCAWTDSQLAHFMLLFASFVVLVIKFVTPFVCRRKAIKLKQEEK